MDSGCQIKQSSGVVSAALMIILSEVDIVVLGHLASTTKNVLCLRPQRRPTEPVIPGDLSSIVVKPFGLATLTVYYRRQPDIKFGLSRY